MKISKQAWQQRKNRTKGLCVYCGKSAILVRYYDGITIVKEKILARCYQHWNKTSHPKMNWREEMNKEWISIEERKPKKLQRVLVSFLNDNEKRWHTIAEYIPYREVLEEDYISD